MALLITVTVKCDGCGAIYYSHDNPYMKGYELRGIARQAGWIYTGNKDLCYECRPKRHDGKNIKSPKYK